jgi:hypothetical protein
MSWRANTLFSVGGLLVIPGLAFVGKPKPPVTPVSAAMCNAVGNEIVPLQPTGAVATAGGEIELKPVMSPFGVSVTTDGRYQYDATATVKNLPAASSMGPYTTWVLWVATPSLDKIRNLGAITNGQPLNARVDFTKMMYMVSAEPSATVDKFHALVLVGRSSSARVQNLAGCDIYDEQSRMGG